MRDMANLKGIKMIIAGIIVLILSSCYDKVELEDRGLVMTIGIDKYQRESMSEDRSDNQESQSSGESNNYNMAGYSEQSGQNSSEANTEILKFENENGNNRFTVTINKANIQNLIGESESENHTIIVNHETIAGAINIMNLYSNQNMYLGYAEAVVLGETLLEDEELFREAIDTLERNREISREIFVVSTKGSAKDVLSESIKSDKVLGMFVSKFYKNNNSIGSARVFHKNLESLSKSLYRTENAIIPKLEIDDGNVKLNGVAIIKDFRLKQWLNATSIKGYLWILGKGEGITISTKINDTYVPLNINKNTKRINFSEDNGKLICEVDLKISGTIEGYNFAKGGLFDKDLLDKLSLKYKKIIKNEIEETFHLFQNVYLIDAFELFELLQKKDYSLYTKYKDLENSFNSMQMRTNVTVEITSIGSIK